MLRVLQILTLSACMAACTRGREPITAPSPVPGFDVLTAETGVGGLPARIRHTATGMVLVLIGPGTFTMGSPVSEPERDGDEAQHRVEIDPAFYLGETEVTVAEWRQVMGTVPEDFNDNDELPATGVNWHAAKRFLERLHARGEVGWRLPTEAEWEYACRAGTESPFSFGDRVSVTMANFDGNRPYPGSEPGPRPNSPVPVRSLSPNPWGLYEMHGNVWEWCEDLYVEKPADGVPVEDDVGGASRVMRGGSWFSRADQLRCGYRDGYPPNSAGEKYGLRLAYTIPR